MFGLWSDPLKPLVEGRFEAELKVANARIRELEAEIESIWQDMAGEDI